VSVELIEIAILFLGAKLGGILFNKIRLPSLGGELLAGVILGSVLGLVTNSTPIQVISQLGLIFLILITTMSIDFSKIEEQIEKLVTAQILSLLIQFVLLIVVMFLFGLNFYFVLLIMAGTFGTSTSLAIRTIFSLKALDSKEGQAIVGLEIINTIIELVLISFVLGVVKSQEFNFLPVVEIILMVVGIFAVMSRVGYRFISFIVNSVQKFKIEDVLMALTLMLVFLSIGFAETLGISSFLGIMLVGLLISRTQQAPIIMQKFKELGESFFIPIFFASLGLGVSLVPLLGNLSFLVIIVVSLILMRLIIYSIPLKFFNFSPVESVKIGSAMISSSAYGLFLISIGLQYGLVDNVFYSVFVVGFLLIDILAPLVTTVFFKLKEPKYPNGWNKKGFGNGSNDFGKKIKKELMKKKIHKKRTVNP